MMTVLLALPYSLAAATAAGLALTWHLIGTI